MRERQNTLPVMFSNAPSDCETLRGERGEKGREGNEKGEGKRGGKGPKVEFLDSQPSSSDPLQLSIGVAVLCLPWLRWKRPDLARPIKVNLFFPILYIIASVFVTVVPMYASPLETGKFLCQT